MHYSLFLNVCSPLKTKQKSKKILSIKDPAWVTLLFKVISPPTTHQKTTLYSTSGTATDGRFLLTSGTWSENKTKYIFTNAHRDTKVPHNNGGEKHIPGQISTLLIRLKEKFKSNFLHVYVPDFLVRVNFIIYLLLIVYVRKIYNSHLPNLPKTIIRKYISMYS